MRKHSRPRWNRPVLFKASLKTNEDAHNTADTKYSVSPVEKIAERKKNGKGTPKLINLPRKKQSCIYVNKMDCDTAGSKQEKCDEISNEMKNVSIKIYWKRISLERTPTTRRNFGSE